MKTILTLFVLVAAFCAYSQQVPNVPPRFQSDTVNIGLGWDNGSGSTAPYTIIRRGVVPGVYTEMAVLDSTQTTYTWTNAPAFLTNYFVASHRNANGEESVPSNEVSQKPAGRLVPPMMQEPKRVTAMFKVSAPAALEQVSGDSQTRLWIFMPDKDGKQNVWLSSTHGPFEIVERPKLKTISIP